MTLVTEFKTDENNVLFIGNTSSLRTRILEQHMQGTARWSTFRDSIGSLFRYDKVLTGESNRPNEYTFDKVGEEKISEWIKNNVVFYYLEMDAYLDEAVKELVKLYEPPLNIVNNPSFKNVDFKKELKELRKYNSSLNDNR